MELYPLNDRNAYCGDGIFSSFNSVQFLYSLRMRKKVWSIITSKSYSQVVNDCNGSLTFFRIIIDYSPLGPNLPEVFVDDPRGSRIQPCLASSPRISPRHDRCSVVDRLNPRPANNERSVRLDFGSRGTRQSRRFWDGTCFSRRPEYFHNGRRPVADGF